MTDTTLTMRQADAAVVLAARAARCSAEGDRERAMATLEQVPPTLRTDALLTLVDVGFRGLAQATDRDMNEWLRDVEVALLADLDVQVDGR